MDWEKVDLDCSLSDIRYTTPQNVFAYGAIQRLTMLFRAPKVTLEIDLEEDQGIDGVKLLLVPAWCPSSTHEFCGVTYRCLVKCGLELRLEMLHRWSGICRKSRWGNTILTAEAFELR